MITDELLRLRETERLELRRTGDDILVRLERDQVAVSDSLACRLITPELLTICLSMLRERHDAIDEPDANVQTQAVLNRLADYDAPDAA